MKKLIFVLALIGWFTPPQIKAETKKPELKKLNYYYTCPMHPNVHSDHPGNCPICHMTLVKKMLDEKPASVSEKLDVTSEVSGHKNIQVDKTTFSSSGATLYKIENKNINFTIRAYGKALSPTRFTIQIAEVDLPFVSSGLDVQLKSASMNLSDYQGKITSIDNYLEPMGKTVRAEGNLFGKNMIKAESSLIASISIPRNNIIAIPEDALLHNAATAYVFVYDEKNSLLRPVKVVTGMSSNGEVEILNGLSSGMVITRGANFLLDSESRMQFSYDQKNN
jgi:Cu(I)/Ag(I) efflux system membrane fusion protein